MDYTDYISAEEFLKQPKKVQKELKDWWMQYFENGDDLIPFNWRNENTTYQNIFKLNYLFNVEDSIPLFTEGQLRKFIEEKTKCVFDVVVNGKTLDNSKWEYCISCFTYDIEIDSFDSKVPYTVEAANLLQAYWQVAIKVATEI